MLAMVMASLLQYGCDEPEPPWDITIKGVAGHPAWAPDGRTVLYEASGELWSVDLQGHSVCLTAGWGRYVGTPDVSPDGHWVAFGDGTTIFKARFGPDGTVDTNTVVALTSTGSSHFPRWSPDGASLAFDSNMDGGFYRIMVMDSSGAGLLRLPVIVGAGDARKPCWSPDGAKLAYFTYVGSDWARIAVVGITGGTGPRVLRADSADYRNPDWAPDGARLTFARMAIRPPAYVDSPVQHHVCIADTALTHIEVIGLGSDPRWSPDGRLLAYTALVKVTPSLYYETVFVIDLTTRAVTQLVWY